MPILSVRAAEMLEYVLKLTGSPGLPLHISPPESLRCREILTSTILNYLLSIWSSLYYFLDLMSYRAGLWTGASKPSLHGLIRILVCGLLTWLT